MQTIGSGALRVSPGPSAVLDAKLNRRGAVGRQDHFFEGLPHGRPVIGMHVVQSVCAEEEIGLVAEDSGDRGTHVANRRGGVQNGDDLESVLEEQAESLLAGPQLFLSLDAHGNVLADGIELIGLLLSGLELGNGIDGKPTMLMAARIPDSGDDTMEFGSGAQRDGTGSLVKRERAAICSGLSPMQVGKLAAAHLICR